MVYYSDGTINDLGDREYVKKALNGGETVVSDLLISRITNNIVLMFAAPIEREGGEVVGVLVGRRDGNTLSHITDDIGFGEEGYAI